MSRSPLAYPLKRSIDGDAGGAADLQTDIMRFMAILSLCLVAIFALVQSLPMAPVPAAASAAPPDPAPVATPPQPAQRPDTTPPPARPAADVIAARPEPAAPDAIAVAAPPQAPPITAAPAQADEGFTLRFASDRALTRLVARGDVALFALSDGEARQLTVHRSRLSFWSSRQPPAFHEMERSTVPGAVIDALGLTGRELEAVRWGVTLPGRLSSDLDRLMREHAAGALVIGADGTLRLEPS